MSQTAARPEAQQFDDAGLHAEDTPIDLSVYKWEDWLTLIVFWLLAFTVFYQFFTRYVLDDSAAWTEEIARYLLIVVTFLGGSMAVRRNTHIHVEFLYRYLPAPVGRAMSTMVDLVRLAFLAYATWLSIDLVPRMHNLGMTVVDLPMSYVYGFVAAGFAMMTFRAAQVTVRHWKRGWSSLERPGEAD
ncbi:TRAP transporter small permease [Burkholderiaceae bacterium FT117]|uniref:TRAP transporter small permease n=1 Tax=Zeimonas sediminis TaxID=2944268 RepID=UPI002342F566|nr:TRAP transporter small permease [Zeimonas sediminis]MCM5570731.1 TRAP transporter small permease [Zeimonas sediminis]